MTQLQFFRVSSLKNVETPVVGGIYFDLEDKTINVRNDSGWDKFAGNLKDIDWNSEDKILTINKYDGSTISLGLGDIASASGVAASLKAITDRLDVVEGEGEGSIKKALADAKAYSNQKAADIVGDAAEEYNTLGKLEDKIQALNDSSKSYSIQEVTGDDLTALGANVKEAYKLVQTVGETSTTAGEIIKVYKDSSLKEVKLEGQELVFTYILTNGEEDVVKVDVSNFLAESEFQNGLQVVDHVVSVKKDETSEAFLSVSGSGVKVSGVQDAINNAVSGLANGAVKTNADAIATLVGTGEGSIDAKIDSKITALDLANTYDAKGAAATAEQNAKDYADSLAGNYDAAGTAAGLNAAMDTRVKVLEAIDHDKLAADAAASAISNLDSTATAADTNSYVSITIAEVDGKVVNEGSSVAVKTGSFVENGDTAGLAVVSDVKAYVDDKVTNGLT